MLRSFKGNCCWDPTGGFGGDALDWSKAISQVGATRQPFSGSAEQQKRYQEENYRARDVTAQGLLTHVD